MTLPPSIFPHLLEVADALEGEDWLLVGGAMTQVHCHMRDVEYARPTRDVDVVVDPNNGSTLVGVARRLEHSGFFRVAHLGTDRYLHRFQRDDGFAVDVMGKDSDLTPDRWLGFRVVKCPGSKSALGQYSNGDPKEVYDFELGNGRAVRVPNVWSALALKGRALRQPSANRERHTQDSIALLACADRTSPKRELTKSEREAVNYTISSDYLGDLGNWTPLAERHWAEALREIRRIRPQGDIGVPELLRPI